MSSFLFVYLLTPLNKRMKARGMDILTTCYIIVIIVILELQNDFKKTVILNLFAFPHIFDHTYQI